MSGSVPKIKVETEQSYTPVKVKNQLNVDGITLTHDDSDDSQSTVEPDEIPVPQNVRSKKIDKFEKQSQIRKTHK